MFRYVTAVLRLFEVLTVADHFPRPIAPYYDDVQPVPRFSVGRGLIHQPVAYQLLRMGSIDDGGGLR